jgi:hypothetical protein
MVGDDRPEGANEVVVPSTVRQVFRRRTSRSEFQFVDDRDQVLGVMAIRPSQRFLLNNGTTTTKAGSFRSVGTGLNHRMEDCRTGERVLGQGIGWRLPDGQQLSVQMSIPRRRPFTSPRVLEYRFQLRDSDGLGVIELTWLPPVSPFWGKFPNGEAVLASKLPRTIELVPLLSYAFQRFQHASQPSGGGG